MSKNSFVEAFHHYYIQNKVQVETDQSTVHGTVLSIKQKSGFRRSNSFFYDQESNPSFRALSTASLRLLTPNLL